MANLNNSISECGTLGKMMDCTNAVNYVFENLETSDFFFPETKIIFSAMHSLYNSNSRISIDIVFAELCRIGKDKDVGGMKTLADMSMTAGVCWNIEEHVEIIKQMAILRSISSATKRIDALVSEIPKNASSVIDFAQNILYEMEKKNKTSSIKSISETYENYEESGEIMPFPDAFKKRIFNFVTNGSCMSYGMSTGIADLDALINGFYKKQVIILAAKPGCGKTTLAMNIAEHMAIDKGIPVGVFSVEMSHKMILDRTLSSRSGVSKTKISTAKDLTQNEIDRVLEAGDKIKNSKIYIDDESGISIATLRSRANRMKELFGIQFLVIDYLQLITSGAKQESRHLEIGNHMKVLLSIAKTLDIPILCLAQLSRKADSRGDKTPRMGDLRESGSIEADAHVIIMLEDIEGKCPGAAEVPVNAFIVKNRQGPTGVIGLNFKKSICKFDYLPPIGFFTDDEFSKFQQRDKNA